MRKLAFVVTAAAAVLCARAEAAVYTYTPTSISDRGNQHLVPSNLAFTLTIADAAVEAGSFNYGYTNSAGMPLRQGDVADFQSFIAPFVGVSLIGSPTGLYQIDITLTFSADHQISNGQIYYTDDARLLTVGGSASEFDGNFVLGSFSPINSVTGFISTSVPEPASLILLTSGVVVFGLRRRSA